MSGHGNSHDHVLEKMHPHPLSNLVFYFMGGVFIVLGFYILVPLIWVGLVIIALGEVSRLSENFYILESGVAREYRLFSTSRTLASYEKIQNVEVRQSVIQNIFGIGSIHFDTAGGDHTEVGFYGVKNPYRIESIVHEKMAGGHGHHHP